jgi:hypothetical protein
VASILKYIVVNCLQDQPTAQCHGTLNHVVCCMLLPLHAAAAAAGGLDDVGNLLRLIGASPFDSSHTFRRAIREPFAASIAAAAVAAAAAQQHAADNVHDNAAIAGGQVVSYGRVERDGVRRLLALLQPLMWRSNKEAAAADHPLPPR